MARARNIKPGFFKNEDLGTADPFVSLLFAGLWTLADKAGILEDRPLRIKAELFPYRDGFDINGYLTVLVAFGFIHRYEVAGVKYIQVAKFTEHQNPHHTEKPSEYPSYSDSCALTVKAPLITGDAPADSLIPDSLIPDSLIPDSLPSPPAKNADGPGKADTELQAACKTTWQAYSSAFNRRYGTMPVRNQSVNSQIKQYVQRIGFVEAPLVAEWYVGHQERFYVQKAHGVGPLLADCEKLRTEWATGRIVSTDRPQTPQEASLDIAQQIFRKGRHAANGTVIDIDARGEIASDGASVPTLGNGIRQPVDIEMEGH
jgi:hypothetical protein